jgi:uncharacterized damage-inducible protein DinB
MTDAAVPIIRDLIGREITSVIEDMRMYPEEQLWWTPDGIANSGGVLAQHLAGNLEHFIGHGLGNTGYVRQRDLEFSDRGRSKGEIIALLEHARDVVADTLEALDESRLSDPFPIKIPVEANTLGFLIYLYHHLSYHHGQINYLRRIAADAR